MPPVLMKEFPEKLPKNIVYLPLFDGQCWKVSPEDYDYNISEIKTFIGSLKLTAHKLGFYIRTSITIDDHVVIQRRPLDYKSTRGDSFRKKG